MSRRAIRLIVITTMILIQVSSLFAVDYVIDGEDKTQDDILMELILDADNYNGKTFRFDNFTYWDFGTRTGKVGFYQCDPWFKDPMTYSFYQSDQMYSYWFNFCFQPNTVDGKKYAMTMNTKNYTTPKSVSVSGKFIKHTLNTGKVLYFFLVEELTILDVTYTGSIPERITR